jgi:pimeloyl-ACP methyl ester carboxylesterase
VSATIGLVHGAWHDGSCWELLVPALEQRGYRVVAPTLPIDDPESGFEEYAELMRDALADADDAVVVGHSLASDTLPLVAAARPLRLVIYLSPRFGAFAAPDAGPDFVENPAMPRIVDDLGRSVWEPDDAVERMYPRLPRDLAERMAARLRPQANLRKRPYPLAVLPEARSALIHTSEDEFFRQEWFRAAARVVGAEPVVLPGGHFSMLERPEELAEAIDRVIRATPAPGA